MAKGRTVYATRTLVPSWGLAAWRKICVCPIVPLVCACEQRSHEDLPLYGFWGIGWGVGDFSKSRLAKSSACDQGWTSVA